MTELLKCLVCDSTDLTNYLNLGNHPLANSFPAEAGLELTRYPLRVNFCNNCFHNQLSELVDPEVLFSDYLYVSGTSQTLKDHFRDLAAYCKSLVSSVGNPSVLSIGCNDATDLEAFRAAGFNVQGVDPAENLRPLSWAKGIDVHIDYWSTDTAIELNRKFNCIIACNVLAHNYNPKVFLEACTYALAPEGVIVLEFPIYTHTVNKLDVGQIYHEHLGFLTLASISHLCSLVNLQVEDVIDLPQLHGGTARVVLSKNVREPHSSVFRSKLNEERRRGFHSIQKYSEFSHRLVETFQSLNTAMSLQRNLGLKIIGYGAAAKTSTILNSAPGLFELDYIVDDAPLKVGRFVPGANVPIKPTSALAEEEGPMAIVLFAHNFKDEIVKRIKSLRPPMGDVIINIVPEVSVEELYG